MPQIKQHEAMLSMMEIQPIIDTELNEDVSWRVENMDRTWGFIKSGTVNIPIFHRIEYEPPYKDWDHDHCEGCTAKLMQDGLHNTLSIGFADAEDTENAYSWLCDDCYRILDTVLSGKIELTQK